MRLVLLGALALGTAIAAQQGAQPRDPRPSEPAAAGTGVIRGRVVAADSGVPVRRATVQLSSNPVERTVSSSVVELAPGAIRRVVGTDDDGRYEITGLPSGMYSMLVMPGPYRSQYRGASTRGAVSLATAAIPGAGAIELGPGEARTLDVALPRAGAISGRVVDDFGEPLSRIQVSAVLASAGNDVVVTGTAPTDDRGMFRLYGLGEGDYLVVVDARSASGPTQSEGQRFGFPRTYAPGTPRREEAARVSLAAGGEASVEIRLVEVPLYDIAGRILNEAGQPLSGAHLSLMTGDSTTGSGTGTDANGRFVIRGVAAGAYQLAVNYTPPAPSNIGSGGRLLPPEFVLTRIQVYGSMEDLVLVTAKGETFTGSVRFEGASPAERTVHLSVHPPERRPFTLTPRLEVKGELFTAEGVFGPLLIRGNAIDRLPDPSGSSWQLKAVTLDGQDITDTPTVFKAAHSGRVEMIFTRRAATLQVEVTDDAGAPAREGSLILFGDEETWVLSSSRTRVVPLFGRKGRITIPGLRSGRYYVAAISGAPVAANGPRREFLADLKRVATPVLLNEGEVRPVEIRMTSLNR